MSNDETKLIGIDESRINVPEEENEKPEENIVEAVNKVASSMEMNIHPIAKQDDGPIDKNVLIRTTENDRDRWKQAADLCGMNLSAWIRELLNDEARRLLECNHPMELMKIYPWAKICGKCNKRLSGKS
jgi:predicted DNA binding CopG/RHH family protein